jgi:hypothetical protein
VSIRFSDFLAENRELDEAAFVARHPYPFLVSEGSAAAPVASASEPTRKIEKDEMRGKTGRTPAPSSESSFVVPIRKATERHATIITCGRGEECDVRLGHPLVSKKHAYFTTDATGAWLLCDAESTNGTWCEGTRLEAHKPFKLEDGAALRFGPALKLRFFGNRAFFEFVNLRARMKTS